MTEGEIKGQVKAATEAIDEALQGLISFMAPLRPALRNELIQLLGHHIERARAAKEKLDELLRSWEEPGGVRSKE